MKYRSALLVGCVVVSIASVVFTVFTYFNLHSVQRNFKALAYQCGLLDQTSITNKKPFWDGCDKLRQEILDDFEELNDDFTYKTLTEHQEKYGSKHW